MSLQASVGSRAQPLRRDARARPPARHGAADPARLRAREAAAGRTPTIFKARTIDMTWPVAEGPDGHGRRRSSASAARPTRRSRRASTSSSSPTAPSAPSGRRSRRCSRSPPSTTTSSARARACRPASSSSPASRARSTRRDADRLRRRGGQPVPDARDARRARRRWAGCPSEMTADQAQARAVKALGKGLLKTISKMGISTIQSYCGAQIFEAVGLDRELVDRHFTGTASRIGGVGTDDARARGARPPRPRLPAATAGRRCCPSAASTPGGATASTTSGTRRRSRCSQRCGPRNENGWRDVRASTRDAVNEDAARRCDAARAAAVPRRPERRIPLEEVEPASEIVKRFATGAMSLGSISREAHETLAIAMNRLGGSSNTGEGGEDPRRFTPDANGDLRRSAIKQVASGRFGVDDRLPRRTPTSCRSRWPRARSPARAASCPATRSTSYIASVRLHDARRRPDLAAAAPRHLLDRGPQAADLRPALRQPEGARSR